MRVHLWVNPVVIRNNRSNITTDMVENVPQIRFSAFIQPVWIFWGKNFKILFGILFPTEKVLFIFVVQRPSPSKMVMPSKNYFSQLFWKILFLIFEKIVKGKIFKTSFPTRKIPLIFVARCRLAWKWSCPPTNTFSPFLTKILLFRKTF